MSGQKKAVIVSRIVIWTIRKLVMFFLLLMILLTGASVYDALRLSYDGMDHLKYHDFSELTRWNPDTRAWLSLDHTHIDYPVVQAEDNFYYLDHNFYREEYAGGSIFLDYRNRPDLSDPCIVIHGHNMAGDAMFGGIRRFLDRSYFQKHRYGLIRCHHTVWKLETAGVLKMNAYDNPLYRVEEESGSQLSFARKHSLFWREGDDSCSKVLVLSTCAGDMSDERILLVLRMEKGDDREE